MVAIMKGFGAEKYEALIAGLADVIPAIAKEIENVGWPELIAELILQLDPENAAEINTQGSTAQAGVLLDKVGFSRAASLLHSCRLAAEGPGRFAELAEAWGEEHPDSALAQFTADLKALAASTEEEG